MSVIVGMAAGDNTLNALTALETTKVLQKFDPDGKADPKMLRAKVMENYVRYKGMYKNSA